MLKQTVQSYLEVRRACGFKLKSQGDLLRSFAAYSDARGKSHVCADTAIEWAGFRMRLASGATGSLLAALGTSLPEFVVPVVALAAHSPSADSVAMGAVIGAPFLLLTIGAGITGLAVLTRRGARELVLDKRQPRRDLGVFLVAYPLALLAIALPQPLLAS